MFSRKNMDIPKHLKHKPIIGVDYADIDAGVGDAQYLSLGRSTWDENDVSAKIFRKTKMDKWSRQGEELPLWRVLDLAILLAATITKQQSSLLHEECVTPADGEFLDNFLQERDETYRPRLLEIKRLLANFK